MKVQVLNSLFLLQNPSCRNDDRTKDVPLIFLTSRATKEDLVKGFEVGGQDYITKPFGIGEAHYDKNFGLGLKVTKLIMEAHNGDIIIENREKG